MFGKRAAAGIAGTLTAIAGGDAAVLSEQPVDRMALVAEERVEAKQIGSRVETTLPWKDAEPLKVTYDMGRAGLVERFRDVRREQVLVEEADFGDGGFKIDVILNERPDTNRFCYTIENHEHYNFYRQPPLYEKHGYTLPQRGVCTETECDTDGDGEMDTFRPLEIVNSFAVYHKEKRNHRIGGENYATGKVQHIPYPEVWEINNPTSTRERAEHMTFEDGQLCVTVRQSFLDNATYPVRVDPTFGYTSVGGSTEGWGGNYILASGESTYSPESDGTIDSMTMYNANTSDFTPGRKAGVYDISDNLIAESAAEDAPMESWVTMNVAGSPEILSSETYRVCALSENGGSIAYDDAGTGNSYRYNELSNFADSFPDPINWTEGASGNHEYSIYATYTAAGGGSSNPQPTQSEYFLR